MSTFLKIKQYSSSHILFLPKLFKSKKLIFLIFLQLEFLSSFSQPSFCKNYNCEIAIGFYQENQNLFESISEKNDLDLKIMFSIVAPEVIIYNQVRDYCETEMVELLYIQFGNSYGDFSIGPFQMKPSFIEQIEKIVSDTSSEFHWITEYNSTDEKKIREMRIKRLKDPVWQINYLYAFYGIMLHKYKNCFYNDTIEEIRFFATAYNRGFTKNEEEIKRHEKINLFPRSGFNSSKYNYAEISIEIFKQLQ